MTAPTSKNSARSPFLLRRIRTQPHLYSAICKARMFYSRKIAGTGMRRIFKEHRDLFILNETEKQQAISLRQSGYALLSGFFPPELMDHVFFKADSMFHNLEIDMHHAYSIQTKQRTTLQGLSYSELAASEKTIALRDPLIRIPEVVDIAFHESILRIAANFLGYVPPLYRVTLVRDFPHNRPLHSSNFHRDNDESDSLQLFIYLVDIDGTRGPLVYVPGSNHYDVRSCRPRLSRDLGVDANDGRLSDKEVESVYPRRSWAVLHTQRGSVAAIHGNGIHKGPVWSEPGSPNNRPRTAIKLDLHGYKVGVSRGRDENRMLASDYARMSDLQRLFAHATLVEKEVAHFAHAN